MERIEIIPGSGVCCNPITLATAKSKSSASKSLLYLMKRFFTQDELAKSSLGSNSQIGYKQLEPTIVAAVRG